MERRNGFRSSFNLIPEGPYQVEPELRAWIEREGFEVGIHDLHHDGKLYRSHAEFSKKAERINGYVREWKVAGFRSAYMHHNLDWIGQLEVQYDASTFDTDPFEPQPDGVGTIFPFWVPKKQLRERGQVSGPPEADGYVELPYTLVQDSTLFLFLGEKDIGNWKSKVDWIASKGGMVLVNVHPDYVNFDGSRLDHEFPAALYEELLQYLREKYAGQYWHGLPREVAKLVTRENVLPSMAAGMAAESGASIPMQSQRKALKGKRALVLLYSIYPLDPRPRRAAEAMVRAGMEVNVLCLKSTKSEPSLEIINGVRVRRTPLRHSREGILQYMLLYSLFFALALGYVLKSLFGRKVDLVHVHNMPDFLIFAAQPARLRGARLVLDLHDPTPELYRTKYGLTEEHWMIRVLKIIEKASIRVADQVITVNLACRRIFGNRSCLEEKVGVVMNTPEERFFGGVVRPPCAVERRAKGGTFIVMCHGSIFERHGIDLGVRAVKQSCRSIPNIELRLYGPRTPFLDTVLAVAREEGIESQVKFLGAKLADEMVAEIDQADLGIIPNRRSIFTELNTPTRIFEYLSRGVAVISPRALGIQDYYGEDEMIYFELGDAEGLARQIEWVYQHPAQVDEIVRRGQVIYRAHQWSRERDRLLDLVERLLNPAPHLDAQGSEAALLSTKQ